jgi:pimeloyl-ACP methyl ester carboxylesterase
LAAAAAAAVVVSLQVADEPGPYIIAGHSGGGQLGMIFAGTHPTLVKGLALLDSFDSIAIALGYMGSYNVTVTLKNGETVVRPKFTYLTPERGALVDVLRAISPLAWARFITNTGASSNYTYAGASDAVYGNNKEWQAQWVLIHAANNGVEDMSDQLSRLGGRRFWQGTGWPNFGAMPVLLLPAAGTFKPWLPPGCTPETLVANTTCQAEVLADPAAHIYPHLYLSYFDTLSSNVSMVVMPGAHSFPSVVPQLAADRLLEKFAGV